MKASRRQFLYDTLLATTSLTLAAGNAWASPAEQNVESNGNRDNNPIKLSVFSKNLHWLNYEQMARAVAEMGFDGVDLTVRPKGHVLPENVEKDLPVAVKTIRDHGLKVYMITTAIANASDPFTDRILKTAGELGIQYYRMGWFDYDPSVSVQENIGRFNKNFLALQKLNRRYQIHGDYQNHAGTNFGSAVLDLAMGLKDVDPKWIGSQYDIRHATVEGANSWPIGFDLLKTYIKTINLKDCAWAKTGSAWKVENVPLGQGMVDFDKYMKQLKAIKFSGPISLHYEYPLGGAEDGATAITISPNEVFAAMKRDLNTAKSMLTKAGLG